MTVSFPTIKGAIGTVKTAKNIFAKDSLSADTFVKTTNPISKSIALPVDFEGNISSDFISRIMAVIDKTPKNSWNFSNIVIIELF